ncbi:hypothetical protein CEXT_518011 [Caerostris extrusa]|uniref:Uncharacterized protein n=1 Tax=Caerostris extrusa TaxID=172846 RepID=A0AAV4SIH6_CAEEX|nr:hypothetical protein CEXT_518011 [Caerostris extrusa]
MPGLRTFGGWKKMEKKGEGGGWCHRVLQTTLAWRANNMDRSEKHLATTIRSLAKGAPVFFFEKRGPLVFRGEKDKGIIHSV